MSNNSIKNKRLKPKVRYTLLIIIIVFFFLSIGLILSSISFENKKEKKLIYSYSVNQNIDYKVFLYPNSFIEQEYLGMNESYISDLVKKIQTNFSYNYMGSKITPLSYDYQVDAIVRSEYQLKEENTPSQIWNKSYSLIDKQTKNIQDVSQFTINEQVDIDYHFFDNVVSQFRKELKLPITSELIINFKINVHGLMEGKTIDDSKTINIKFPLNQQAFKIKTDFLKTENKNIFEDNETKMIINNRKLICGIIALLSTLTIFITLFRKLFNIAKKTQYQIKRDKYLKEYGDIIIEITTPIINDQLNCIIVKNFNEMIDLEEELRIPISFYEDEDEEFGEFTIIHNDIIYKYTLED